MSDSSRLREDAERRCGENADTVRQLAAENRKLREALEDAIGWIEPSRAGRQAADRARRALKA